MDNTSMCHLNQEFKIKINKQIMRQIEMVCPYRLGWEGHSITFLLYLPKMLNLNLIIMKYLRIPNWRALYKTTGLNIQCVEIIKVKEKLGTIPDWTKLQWHNTIMHMCNSRLSPFLLIDITKIIEISMISG